MRNTNKHILIVGGGMTGLAAAYILAKNKQTVTLIEASSSLGGVVKSFDVGGNRLEHYYHHFFTHDKELLWLCEELGITDKQIFKNTKMGVFRNKKIYGFNGLPDLLKFKPMSMISKIRFVSTSMYLGRSANWRNSENISALAWFYKLAGKEVTECLWKPLLNIKFGDFANVVPLSWMIGRLSQRMRSRSKGNEQLGYFEGGFETVITALETKLKEMGVTIVKNSSVLDIEVGGNEVVAVKTDTNRYVADQYLFTVQTPQLKEIVKTNKSIEYFSAVCVILEMKKALSDVYWLSVADPGFPFGGVIEHTNFIESRNYNGIHLAYLSRYYASSDPLALMGEDEIAKLMIPRLSDIYPNFKSEDIIKYHVFKAKYAAPVVDLNFSQKVDTSKTAFTNLFIGNMTHVYPDERSCNNSIRVAATICKLMGFDTSFIPEGTSLAGVLC